jgi:hypothetical protein
VTAVDLRVSDLPSLVVEEVLAMVVAVDLESAVAGIRRAAGRRDSLPRLNLDVGMSRAPASSSPSPSEFGGALDLVEICR